MVISLPLKRLQAFLASHHFSEVQCICFLQAIPLSSSNPIPHSSSVLLSPSARPLCGLTNHDSNLFSSALKKPARDPPRAHQSIVATQALARSSLKSEFSASLQQLPFPGTLSVTPSISSPVKHVDVTTCAAVKGSSATAVVEKLQQQLQGKPLSELRALAKQCGLRGDTKAEIIDLIL